jgi:hypothetical protein
LRAKSYSGKNEATTLVLPSSGAAAGALETAIIPAAIATAMPPTIAAIVHLFITASSIIKNIYFY